MTRQVRIPTSTHWGNYLADVENGTVVAVHAEAGDSDPSPIGRSLLDSQHAGCRIPRPCVRRGYLEALWRSDGSKRGVEPTLCSSIDKS